MADERGREKIESMSNTFKKLERKNGFEETDEQREAVREEERQNIYGS